METKAQLSESELRRLKKQYWRVYEITVEDDGEAYAAYFRRPDMSTLSAMTKMAKTDEIQASKVLLENCFVGGAEEVKTDTALFLAVVGQLSKVVGSVRATLKNV